MVPLPREKNLKWGCSPSRAFREPSSGCMRGTMEDSPEKASSNPPAGGSHNLVALESRIHARLKLSPRVKVFVREDRIAFFNTRDFCVVYATGEVFRRLIKESA